MSEITDYLINVEIAKQTNPDIIKDLKIAKEIVNTSGYYSCDDIEWLKNKEQISSIVTWMIQDGIEKTSNGNWHISFNKIIDKYGVTKEWISEVCEDIKDEIDSRDEILSDTWFDEYSNGNVVGFDMNFCLSVCKGWDGTEDWGCGC